MEHLIPQAWFDQQATWMLAVVAVAALAALIKGADLLVDGASGLAYRLGVPKVIVGATVVSLGTTSPEAAVSVMAAWSGEPGLALGNAVGSIVADTGLIFGVACLLTVLPADRFVLSRQGWVQFGSAVLLAALSFGAFAMYGGASGLGTASGALLLFLLVAYLVASIRWSRQHSQAEPFQLPDDITPVTVATGESPQQAKSESAWWQLGLIAVGLAIVLMASRVLICAVTVIAERFNIPQVVIASTIVALGDVASELATAIASVMKGHKDLLVGNVIGADILNVLFVVGASACAERLPIVDQRAGVNLPEIFLLLHLPAMLVILIVFRFSIAAAIRRGEFVRWTGRLVLLYVAYLVLNYALA